MEKIIITVVGKDTTGIIARVCTYLAESKINILDISQTIVQGYFNMMMIADTAACTKEYRSSARRKPSSRRCTESERTANHTFLSNETH